MHFKGAVLLCALYFVTVTQGIGLNMNQVQMIVEVHEKSKNEIPMEGIKKLVKDISMNNFSHFKYNNDVISDLKVQDLLIFLSINNKTTDDWTIEPSLSSYEVRIYLGVFNKFDQRDKHDGLLNYGEVVQVIDALNLQVADNEKLAGEFKKDDVAINAIEFLLGFLKIKPKGRGLDQSRVQDLIDLHKNHKTDGGHIDPKEITKFFKTLSIIKEDHEDQLVFESIRPAALELQELCVVSADYNKKDTELDNKMDNEKNIEEDVCPLITRTVRYLIQAFSTPDGNKNGLLSVSELKEISKHSYRPKDLSFLIRDFDTDEDENLNTAEYFMATIITFLKEHPKV